MPSLNLTSGSLKSMTPSVLYWDDRKSGLGVRLGKGADDVPTFYVQYRIGTGARAEKRRVRIGKFTGDAGGMSIKDARQRAVEIVADAKRGIDPFAEAPKSTSDDGSLRWALRLHLRRLKEDRRSQDYIETIEWAFEKHVFPALGDKQIADVTRRDLTMMLENIEAPVMRNRVATYVTGLFNRAVKQAWITSNPAGNFDRVAEQKRERFLSGEESALLWKATANLERQGDLGPLFRFMLLTGARLGTAHTMLRSELSSTDFTFEEDGVLASDVPVWTVPPLSRDRQTKTKAAYDIFLSDLALAQIPDRDEEQVFIGERGGVLMAKSNATRDLMKVHTEMERLAGREIEHWTAHCLRHSMITWMARQRAISTEAEHAVVNHSRGGVHDRYVHHDYCAEKREAMILWANHVARLVGEEEQVLDHDQSPVPDNVVSLRGA